MIEAPPGGKSEKTNCVPWVGNVKRPPPASVAPLLSATDSWVDQITLAEGPSIRTQELPSELTPVTTRRSGVRLPMRFVLTIYHHPRRLNQRMGITMLIAISPKP